MKWQTFALILVSVALSAFAQIALKHGMSSAQAQAQRAVAESQISGLSAIATNPYIVLGFALYGLGAVLWLGVLAKIDVGQAYPFVGLGFLLTMLFGIAFLGEGFSVARMAGTALIMTGVVLVAAS